MRTENIEFHTQTVNLLLVNDQVKLLSKGYGEFPISISSPFILNELHKPFFNPVITNPVTVFFIGVPRDRPSTIVIRLFILVVDVIVIRRAGNV
ncbi:hypothetical protein [Petroclostridium xylanilyticum]|uniref:hypothetical protein n=1 Tax=Petroclostridium xylanilyticum TaxID=1792311 RepID=UPI0012FF6B02|nr:hypothetical protein [Petroclostridium xylanilyticum]